LPEPSTIATFLAVEEKPSAGTCEVDNANYFTTNLFIAMSGDFYL